GWIYRMGGGSPRCGTAMASRGESAFRAEDHSRGSSTCAATSCQPPSLAARTGPSICPRPPRTSLAILSATTSSAGNPGCSPRRMSRLTRPSQPRVWGEGYGFDVKRQEALHAGASSEVTHSMIVRRVLVIDDEEDIREVARLSLELVGQYQVLTASSGRDGLDSARSHRPDAILLDD